MKTKTGQEFKKVFENLKKVEIVGRDESNREVRITLEAPYQLFKARMEFERDRTGKGERSVAEKVPAPDYYGEFKPGILGAQVIDRSIPTPPPPDDGRMRIWPDLWKVVVPENRDREFLERIHECMSGVTWSADTLDAIANILEEAGLEIEEPFLDKD